MRIYSVRVKNFRLLHDVQLRLEEQTTVVVGRNNSGKTSFSEVLDRFLRRTDPEFRIEDFSSASHDSFCKALAARNAGLEDDEVRKLIPAITLEMTFHYDADTSLGPLSEFIVDLDPDCDKAEAVAQYRLRDGSLGDFFDGLPTGELTDATRLELFRALRERVPKLFETTVWAQDPGDPTNRKIVERSALRALTSMEFVSAQRGLDDETDRKREVLAGILTSLYQTAASPNAAASDQQAAEDLKRAVEDIQKEIDRDLNLKVKELMPKLNKLGYPGLGGPELETETTLQVEKLLGSHTEVKYAGCSGVHLPESYCGLGMRNLVFILLQLVRFHKEFRAQAPRPGVHVVFIEEPEAHMHPQMQEVFIRQLGSIPQMLNSEASEGDEPWPVQFVVTTHSSHIANEAPFETIRYFMAESGNQTDARRTVVKDLRQGLRDTAEDHRDFLIQYLTLTRCDLFFADKAVLVEGASERLLLPVIIKKLEETINPQALPLSSQYLTVMEVGGAYAHLFFELLDFLELPCLIITDIDSVDAPGGAACTVHRGSATSNQCLRAWFGETDCALSDLIAKTDAELEQGSRRITYQRPAGDAQPCGRSFEEAFILANGEMFGLVGSSTEEIEERAQEIAAGFKKTEFALKHALETTDWRTPDYIEQGMSWLAHAGAERPDISPVAPANEALRGGDTDAIGAAEQSCGGS